MLTTAMTIVVKIIPNTGTHYEAFLSRLKILLLQRDTIWLSDKNMRYIH